VHVEATRVKPCSSVENVLAGMSLAMWTGKSCGKPFWRGETEKPKIKLLALARGAEVLAQV